jgi:hypothetical protein
MQVNSGVHFFLAHFMDHGIDAAMGKLIYKNRIVVMPVWLNFCRNGICKEQGFVVKVDLYVHN